MGLLSFRKTASSQDAADVLARYKRLRPIRLRLNNKLVSRLSRDALREGASRLGMLRGNTFVFDTEDETSVLMDYCIYEVDQHGRNAVEEYLCECSTDPDSDEMACLRAMQDATYTVIVVLDIEPGVGCHVRDLFTDETHLLADIGFSQTAKPGAVFLTRLLDFGSFVTTGGAGLPVGILEEDELEEWQRKLRAGVDDDFDPAPLIRACLEGGASSHIRYEQANAQLGPPAGNVAPAMASSRRKALAKRAAGKSMRNQPCSCGSGKKFKNCCGKR